MITLTSEDGSIDLDALRNFIGPGRTFWIKPYLGTCDNGVHRIPKVRIVDVQDLHDGREYPYRIWKRLQRGLNFIKQDNKVVVRCAGGISRSNSIAAGILALVENVDLYDAVGVVKSKVPRADPDPEFLDSVQLALAIYGHRKPNIPFTGGKEQ